MDIWAIKNLKWSHKTIMSFTFKEMIQSAPSSPGVYQMIDTGDRVLYIGKAKNLKNRLSSYMHSDLLRTQNLIKKVAKITLTICSTEEEALYLEHRFIQNIQPPFNILLKDHKSYPFLVLTTEDYPQILIERSLKHRGQFVQGPYPSLELAKQMLDVIVKTFQIRTCSNYVFQTRSRPCLQYQMQRCSAPCVFQSSKDTVLYRQKIEEVKVFFKEGIDKQIAQLESQMLSASCEEKFEEAANYRDSIKKLRTMQRQSHQDPNQDGVCDLIAYTGGSMLHHMTMVDGKIEKSQSLSMRNPLKHDIDTCIETIVYQLYAPLEEQWIPKVVLADISKKIHVAVGHKHILIRPAQNALERSWLENARESLKCNQIAHNRKSSEEYEEQFTLLEEFFLQSQWQAIECIDVAHHQGKYTVGAISRFHRQGPSKKDYRKYRLNAEGIEQNNDTLSIKQTLLRHLKRRIQDSLLPNLLIIDGGKAQLNSAYSVLIALGI
jgi:excinuclease ABC subunit C